MELRRSSALKYHTIFLEHSVLFTPHSKLKFLARQLESIIPPETIVVMGKRGGRKVPMQIIDAAFCTLTYTCRVIVVEAEGLAVGVLLRGGQIDLQSKRSNVEIDSTKGTTMSSILYPNQSETTFGQHCEEICPTASDLQDRKGMTPTFLPFASICSC